MAFRPLHADVEMFDEWRLPTRYAADSTSTIRVTKDQLDSGLNVRIPKQLDKGVTAFLGSETANPPAVAVPLLRAAWHGLRWKWETGHQIVQGDSSTEGAWAHVWLYRIEGDLVNARYWYRQAQRDKAAGDLREEGRRLQRSFESLILPT